MSEKGGSIRKITKGFLGGLTFGFVLYLAVLFLKVAINSVAGTTVVPDYTELGGLAFGFTGGIAKEL